MTAYPGDGVTTGRVSVYTEVPLDTLPASVTTKGSKVLAALAMFFGAAFTIIPLVALISSAAEGTDDEWLTTAVTFGVVGLLFVALFLWGLNQALARRTIVIDSSEVQWQSRSLAGSRLAAEPLAGFKGILYRTGWTSLSSVTHFLELAHPDPKKTVALYRANRDYDIPERWRRYCRSLGLPPLERLSPNWTSALNTDDIGKPMMARLLEGKLRVPEADPVPPAGVTVDRQWGTVTVSVHGRRLVRVDGEGVLVRYGSGTRDEVSFPYDKIESLPVQEARPRTRAALVLGVAELVRDNDGGEQLSRRQTSLGEGLPVPDLEWVQRTVLQAITQIRHVAVTT